MIRTRGACKCDERPLVRVPPPPDPQEWTLWKFLLTFAVEPWRGTGGGGQLVGGTWSLGVEVRFYVFWPLLLTLWPGVRASRRVWA